MKCIRNYSRSWLGLAATIFPAWFMVVYATDPGSVRELSWSNDPVITQPYFMTTHQSAPDWSYLAAPQFTDSVTYEIPMFSREYRMLVLMRRLVKMVDRRAIRGYETPLEVMEACQDFSLEEQRRLFMYTAAGGMASGLSTVFNSGLGQLGIRDVRWNTEKVFFSRSFSSGLSARIFRTMDEYGMEFRVHQWRFSYRKREYSAISREMYTVWFSNRLGMYYAQIGDREIISPLWKFPAGKFGWSYDLTRKRLVTSMNLHGSDRLHVRAVHVLSGKSRSHHFRGEFYLLW